MDLTALPLTHSYVSESILLIYLKIATQKHSEYWYVTFKKKKGTDNGLDNKNKAASSPVTMHI